MPSLAKRRSRPPRAQRSLDSQHRLSPSSPQELRDCEGVLGIEAGATRTVSVLVGSGSLTRKDFGPANVRLLNDGQLIEHFGRIAGAFPVPRSIGVGMAGARDEHDRARIRKALERIWPGVPGFITHDLEIALEATIPDPNCAARVLVLSGTGSCCFGRSASGDTVKLGGWGHLLGDKGSGYEIALRGLKAVVYYYDREGIWSRLGERLLSALLLNSPEDFISWVANAPKHEIAGLAPQVFAAAQEGDRIARDILEGAASSLARDAVACAKRLAWKQPTQFILAGSVLLKQKKFSATVARKIKSQWPKAQVTPLQREGVWGAVLLAARLPKAAWQPSAQPSNSATESRIYVPAFEAGQSPTEERNPHSTRLDHLSTGQAVELFLSEDAKIIPALRREKDRIVRAVNMVAAALLKGGRLFYAGAGTSGRLGVLDASECPPTFRADPNQVQGIIAGGNCALWQAVEGAEDNPEAGAEAVRFRGVRRGDVVVGIAASGRTPFVWGAFHAARSVGAKTILLTFNPKLRVAPGHAPDLTLAPNVGPEVLTGSTRLKSGTATKLILNMLSTLGMVRLGKVASNLMIDLNPSNVKLRDRAVRILQQLTDAQPEAARQALEENGWIVKDAWLRLKQGRKQSKRST